MKPIWESIFVHQCEAIDSIFVNRKGTTIKEIENFLTHASPDKISDALETGYMNFDPDPMQGALHMGPYVIKPVLLSVRSDYMLNWNDYLWELWTIKRLGKR